MSSDVTIGRYIADDILCEILIGESENAVQSEGCFDSVMIGIKAHALSYRMAILNKIGKKPMQQ
jgi:hypothetical protein